VMLDHATLLYADLQQRKADAQVAVARQIKEGLCSRCGGRRSVARLALETRRGCFSNSDYEMPRYYATPCIMDFPCPDCCGVPLPPRLNPA
jgi:hypothetical protein